jgi:diguanylate cyclase (GGDEF)-like protein/PAS domain S-box-containing protein
MEPSKSNHSVNFFIGIVLCFLTCFSPHSFASNQKDSHAEAIQHIRDNLALTKDEKDWLKAHEDIKIGIDAGYAPYSFLDKENNFIGVAPDFISILSQALNVNFEPIPDLSWPEIVDAAKDKKLDVIATAVITPERLAFLDFSQIYIPTPLVLMTRHKDSGLIQSARDLSGKQVALVGGYSSSRRVLEKFPDIVQHIVESPLEGLQAVSAGEAQAYVGVLGVNFHLAQTHGLSNLVIASRYDLKTNGQRFGVRKDWPELKTILDKALNVLRTQDANKILSKWVPILLSGTTITNSEAVPIEWTQEEKNWLENNPRIDIGIMNAWPPMDYVDGKGQPKGIGAGFIKALNKRLDNIITIVPGTWEDIYNDVKNKKLDALTGITPRKNREEFFNFTDPYVSVPHVIFRRKGEDYTRNLNALAGKVIGAEAGFFIHDVIKSKYPQVRSKEYANTSDAIDALLKGEVDAYVGNRAVAMYTIQSELITNLEEHGKITETASTNAIGVRKDAPILRDIIQKSLANLTVKERFTILKDWVEVTPSEGKTTIELTADEWAWLERHPVIRVAGNANWAPVEYLDKEGVFKGISVEYLNLLSSMLGVSFAHQSSSSWHRAVQKLEQRELDIFSAAASTSDRRKFADFTSPYLSLPAMIFSAQDQPFISSLEELEGKKVSVVRGHAITEFIRRGGWNIELLELDTIPEGLQAIIDQDAFAYIGNILVTSHAIRKLGLTNIRISGQTPYHLDISMGVRSDWPELSSILDKALRKISEEQRGQIAARWIGLQIKEAPDYRFFWTALISALVTLIVFLVWNRYLQNRNRSQSKEIHDQNETLRLNKNSLSNAQRIAKLGSWDWYTETDNFDWSDQLYLIFNLDQQNNKANLETFLNAFHPDDRALVGGKFEKIHHNQLPFVVVARVLHSNNNVRHVKVRGEVINNDHHKLNISGTVLDITERVDAERELQKLFHAFENSPISIVTTDLDGRIEYVNPCFSQTTGYQATEVIGLKASILSTGYTSQEEYKAMWKTIRGGKVWRGEFRNQHKDGGLYWARTTIAPVWDERGKLVNYLSLSQDVSFEKEIEEKLFEEANFSALTKQPNRYYILNRIEQNIQNNESFVLLMVDMVNIKRINDSLGFEAGDKIIKQAAVKLDQLVDKHRIVAHLGGGEFLFMAEQSYGMATEILISHILSCFKQTFDVGDENISQNASIGVALYPDDGNSPEDLLKNAHVAVNHAKKAGRFSYTYSSEKYNKEAQTLLHMENQLGQALAKNELSIFCQPKIDAKTGRFLGAEALCRWFNSDLGSVPPDQFIPLAEETEMILSIGRWVINESCRQASLWKQAGHKDFTIAINMSPKQFLDKEIVAFIKQCLNTHSLEGKQVEIEVTEGLFLEGSEDICKQVDALKEVGLSLALDDFGTGYSSLQYLRSYPFDTLKIDRSFVSNLPESQGDASLVRAITAMGRALGMTIVAEGVEQQNQADFLKEEGCDIFQGYFFGKPMNEIDFSQWLETYNK